MSQEIQAHSKIGASTMHRWSQCPGSVKLCEGIPNKSSVYAEEGTRAHELAAKILLQEISHAHLDNEPDDFREAIFKYVAFVEKHRTLDTFIEQRFDMSEKVYKGLFGTADCVIYDEKTRTLKVIDYKHGAGIAVEAIEDGKPNVQLLYYALGAFHSFEFKIDFIEVTIVQPRAFHKDGPIRTARINAIEILDFEADLIEYAKKTESKNAELKSGEHCRFCPAAGKCPLLKKTANELAKREFGGITEYDASDLSDTLSKLEIVEAWAKSVREFAFAELERGNEIPGWKLVPKRAMRKWKNPEEAAKQFKNQKDCWDEPTLKSPAQIEKVIGKGMIDDLVVSVSSGLTMVQDHDDRPALLRGAKNEFDEI